MKFQFILHITIFLLTFSAFSQSTEIGCEPEKFLKDPNVPLLAKELFENKAINDDRALDYFEKLKSSEKQERSFYFKVITNSYKNADGAYAEGLGHSGLQYIEKNTADFLNYFENKKCFSDTDLKTWVDIVLLEFLLEYENENDKNIVSGFISKTNANCKNCSASQKETLKKFSSYLTKEWDTYLSKQ